MLAGDKRGNMANIISVPVRLSPGVDSFMMLFSQYSTSFQKFDDVLSLVGLLIVGKLAIQTTWDLFIGVRAMFWSRLWTKNFEKRFGGDWAIVTGCTDGIGKAYSHELAKDGLNIVLISRSMDKLNAVATEIEELYGVETEVIQADFAEGEDLYPMIASHLKKKDIGILVNNVGVMVTPPKFFYEHDDHDIRGQINVNMASVVRMTKMILPQMMQRKKGAIVNISSIASTGPLPLGSTYAASKAFVEYFSVALEWESKGTGVTIQTVIPSFVSTNLVKYSQWLNTHNIITPNAKTFAASAVSTIGYTSYTTGYWTHGIQKYITNFMPRYVFMLYMDLTHKFLRNSAKAAQ